MRAVRFLLAVAATLPIMWVGSTVTYAKVEYTKATKKSCVTCHVNAKSKDLNDVGKCYAEKKNLDSCESKAGGKK